ncbi:hypothetical protein DV451_002798 [Geotrichum candidum]|uniref:Peptidase M48 domain-containing protein n=1 Tax=Geotrichum candidum TaxID=1173061 RepID=A0A9P5KU76_GEOCN|nr:hypothetical protein DV451_002798 [Geotrichum candidum]KAF5107633.1 hypothetical protein DV453_002906 [Geotrichum candidum]KAF5119063.1 hypothetical protein DV454_000165 [Geotrichum candidum]
MFRSRFPMFRPLLRKRAYSTYKTFDNTTISTNPYTFILNHWKGLALFAAGTTAFVVTHLDRAPISNRLRFMLIGPGIEQLIGGQGYEEVIREYRHALLPDNHPQVKRVKRIMKSIIDVSPFAGDDTIDWRIHVINDPKASPNAFVLPGGKVFVFSSILPICGNDDGLATVLSHELAHQTARHTAESMSKAPLYLAASVILYSITGSRMLNSIFVNSLLKLPSSREMETEADYIGLIMMSRACYNPNEAINVWERMTNFENTSAGIIGGRRPPEFLSTHPATSRRIDNIRKWLPDAYDARTNARCDERVAGYMPSFLEWNPPRDVGLF